MSYPTFKIRPSVLLCSALLVAMANPASARRDNEVINDYVFSGKDAWMMAPNQHYNNATIKDGATMALLPSCSNNNCDPDGDDYFHGTADGVLVTGANSQLAVGGTATNVTVENGGSVLVGQAGFGAIVSDALRWDSFPASITNTIVKNGGIERILAGGVSTDSTIEAGGKQYVYLETDNVQTNPNKAGTAVNTIVNGGTQYIYGTGARAIDTTITNGAQWIYNPGNGGGRAENTILNGSMQYAYGAGSTAHNTTVGAGSESRIYKTAAATQTTIDGGLQRVYENGTADNTTINSGNQYVSGTGISTNTTVYGGYQQVFGGGTSNQTTVNGGTQNVQNANSVATNNIINNGGRQSIWDNGLVVNSTINAGGSQVVSATGIIRDTTLDGGKSSFYDGAISQGRLDVINGGTLLIQSSAGETSNIENVFVDNSSNVNLIANAALTRAGRSFINITNMQSDGTVSFTDAVVGDPTSIDAFHPITLNIANLSGNTTFAMHANIGDQIGSLVKVDQLDANSNHVIFVANNGASNAQITDVHTVVETTSGGAAEQFNLHSTVEQGGYEFSLRQAGNNWELYATPPAPTPDPDPTPTPDPDPIPTPTPTPPGGGSLTTTAQAAGNFMNTSYLMSYINTQNLMQRMGDLRGIDGVKDVDVWGRGFAGKLSSFDGRLGGFTMNYSGVQIGADKLISLSEDSLRVGVAAGYTDASPKYRGGNGGVRSYNLGIYGTYITENSFYIDALVKYDRIKNNFNVKDTQDNDVSGRAKSNGYGFSIEAGKRFYMQDLREGLYLEPQMQFSYMHQEGDTVRASNGLRVKLSDYDSTLGRVSAAIGYEVKNVPNPVMFYIKTGFVKEFSADDISYRLNNSKEKHSFKGNFWDNEIGISTTINKRHTIHADLNYADGNRFDKQQINVGYRYTF